MHLDLAAYRRLGEALRNAEAHAAKAKLGNLQAGISQILVFHFVDCSCWNTLSRSLCSIKCQFAGVLADVGWPTGDEVTESSVVVREKRAGRFLKVFEIAGNG